ncbi:MAG TPA: DMT family transporter [Acetobacteraceae bacterium]|nr:DMT family transporter [Acetobacteraceae bacterium]
MSRHTQGVVLIVLSAIAYSSAGFFTRLIHLDAWTMLFWRGLFAGLMILCVIVVQERGRTVAAMRAIGAPGCVAAVCSTAATILYLNAFRRTSVADVAVIFAVAPFLTAGIGWLFLGVTEAWATLAASVFAVVGVAIMFGGAATEGHLVGDLLAVGMATCMAVMMLIIRQQRQISMLPAACLSALLCPAVVWPFASPFTVGGADMLNLFLFGTTQFGLGLVFLTVGGRLVSATENALINTLETPLAVAWVWGCFGEMPSVPSFVGGVVVMAAVGGHLWYSSRRPGLAAATS